MPGPPARSWHESPHTMRLNTLALAACSLLTLATPAVQASDKPLWELGLGVGALRLPHYKGADQQHTWILPVPYVVYRGDIFRADREGARAVLLDGRQLDIDISVAASAPTQSSDNAARQGMDDLKPTLELGPNVNWRLGRGQDVLWGVPLGWKLELRLPWRAAFTVASDPRYIGWTAAPNLNLDLRTPGGWNIGLLAGPVFNARRFSGYYYDVDAAHATSLRPSYRSDGGYAGSRALMALSRRFEQQWLGAFVQVDSLHGARFEDSPLVRQKQNVSFGVAMAWVLKTSERSVANRE
jgi:outer membrane protein